MTSRDLELALRECLTRQAGAASPLADLAEPALHRARRIRRGRRSAGAALALLIVVGVVGGGWRHVHRDPTTPMVAAASSRTPGPPTAAAVATSASATATSRATPVRTTARYPAPAPSVSVELVVADRLHTAMDGRIDLSRFGPVSQARRTAGGWLVVGAARAGRSALWLVPPRGAPRVLIAAADAVVLEPDGPRVSWLAGGRAAVATVARGELVEVRDTPLPPRVRPVGFVGEGVLLAGGPGGPEPRGYGVWWPARPGYQATWNGSLTAVYGELPDGRVVAQVAGDGGPCLALLAAGQGLPVLQRACGVPLATADTGSVSPDGRWLLANAAELAEADSASNRNAADSGAVLVELGAAFQRRPAVRAAGPRLTGTAVWTDPGSVLHASGSAELVRVASPGAAAGAPATVDRVRVPAARPGDPVLLVPGPRT